MKKKLTNKSNTKNFNFLDFFKQYFSPILMLTCFILGNIICYKVNSRFLTAPTNLIFCFVITATIIRSTK